MISTISFLCFDFTKNQTESFCSLGGKAYYTGLALANLGEDAVVITRSDGSERINTLFSHPKLRLYTTLVKPMPKHYNTYFGKNQEKRVQNCFSDNYQLASIDGLEEKLAGSAFIHLGPSNPEEIDAKVMAGLSRVAPLAADMDYLLKSPYDGTRLGVDDISDKLSSISIAMISHDDVPKDRAGFIREIAKKGPSEVIMIALELAKYHPIYHQQESLLVHQDSV